MEQNEWDKAISAIKGLIHDTERQIQEYGAAYRLMEGGKAQAYKSGLEAALAIVEACKPKTSTGVGQDVGEEDGPSS